MIRTLHHTRTDIEARVLAWTQDHAADILRWTLGIVFFWFGALKLVPGMSPAEALAGKTVHTLTLGLIPADMCTRGLGVLEVLIGSSLLTGRFLKFGVLALLFQMAGTLTPLVLFPADTWVHLPYEPTMTGQYILKNQVFIGAALIIWASVAKPKKPTSE